MKIKIKIKVNIIASVISVSEVIEQENLDVDKTDCEKVKTEEEFFDAPENSDEPELKVTRALGNLPISADLKHTDSDLTLPLQEANILKTKEFSGNSVIEDKILEIEPDKIPGRTKSLGENRLSKLRQEDPQVSLESCQEKINNINENISRICKHPRNDEGKLHNSLCISLKI